MLPAVMLTEHHYPGREALTGAVVTRCTALLRDAIAARGRASLLASGGSSPRAVYQELSTVGLPWAQVDVALVDERWVAADHAASNERFLRESLLQGRAGAARFLPLKTAATHAVDAVRDRDEAYAKLVRPFDLVVLGMGTDGHTASLFPFAGGLHEALDVDEGGLVAAIHAARSEVTGDHTERLSLTLRGLLESRHLLLLLTGEDKLAVFRTAQAGGDVQEMPVRALLQQTQTPLELYYAP